MFGRLKAKGEAGAEDEMVGWYHQLNGHEFEQTRGDSGEQGSLECFMGSQRVRQKSMTEQQGEKKHLECSHLKEVFILISSLLLQSLCNNSFLKKIKAV